MKRCLNIVLLLVLALSSLSAAVEMGGFFSNPASNGSYEDIFSNPAALPLRDSDGRDFLIGTRFRDDYHRQPFDVKSPYRFLQSPVSDVVLSFSGRTMAFTAVFENSLDRSAYPAGESTANLYSTTHFQLDLGYSLWRFSGGVRISGGNLLERAEKQIVNLFDYIQNSFFTKFDNYDGGEYFKLGVGLMYADDYLSAGFYADRVLYLNDSGSASSSLDEFLSSLSLGIKAVAPRYTSAGELLLIRPSASLSFGNIMSEESSITLAGGLTFQLLPDSDLDIVFGYSDYRDARSDAYFSPRMRYTIFSLGFTMSGYSVEISSKIPLSVYRGEGDDAVSMDFAFRVRI